MWALRVLAVAFCLGLTWRQSFGLPNPEALEDELAKELADEIVKRLLETEAEAKEEVEEPAEEQEEDFAERLFDMNLQLEARATDMGPVLKAPSQITNEERKTILRLHRQERNILKPDVIEMKDIIWDNELAQLAQGLANTCEFEHKNMRLRNTDKSATVGQNLARGGGYMGEVEYLVNQWINEKQFYSVKTGECARGQVCGHYTAMIWSKTTKVGCGIKKCPSGRYLVCDYKPPGNMGGETAVWLKGVPPPCKDKYSNCPTELKQHCGSSRTVQGWCPLTCGKCKTSKPKPTQPKPTQPKPTQPKPTQPKPTPPKTSKCKDRSPQCKRFAYACNYKGNVGEICPKTCGRC